MRHLFVAAATASLAVAQQTLVVDIGGGTPFQQIQPAVQAATAGDTIEVRPGVYAPFTCNKPVRILGTNGVVVAETFSTAAITVTGIPSNATCAIGHIDLQSPTTPCICEPNVVVNQCAGLVILDALRPDLPSLEARLHVTDVAGLVLRDSYVGPLSLTRSEAHLAAVTVDTASTTSGALIELRDAQLVMTDGSIRTHRTAGTNFAVRLTNSHASLRAVQGLQINLNQGNHDFLVDGNSSLDHDPGVVFSPLGIPTVWPFGTVGPVTATILPALGVTPAGPGGTAQVTMRYTNPTGFLCAFLAAPGGPVQFPGINGSLFFRGSLITQIGCFATGLSPFTTNLAIPNDPTLSGLLFTAQGIALGGTFPATNVDALRIL